MKLQHWLTIAAACAVSGPVCVWAQAVQGVPPPPATQPSVNRPEGAGSTVPNFLPDIDPALPNRRVPSLAPPRPLDGHPVTPDKAWPKPPSIKPLRPSGKHGASTILNGGPRSDNEGPLQGISGTGGAIPTESLTDSAQEVIQHQPRLGE